MLGFTNREISDLTDGRWSEPAVKMYTKRIRVKSTAKRDEAIKLMVQMVALDLTFDDVKRAREAEEKARAWGSSIEQIASFIQELESSMLGFADFFKLISGILQHGLTIASFVEFVKIKHILDSKGYTLEILQKIAELSARFKPDELLEAIKKYLSLKELLSLVEKANQEATVAREKADGLNSEVTRLEGIKATIEPLITKYENLKSRGYTGEIFSKLEDAGKKFGGLANLMDGIMKYVSIAEMASRKSGMEKQCQELETKFK